MVAQTALDGPTASKLVKAYSYITLAAALYGIAYAHVPFMISEPWDTCRQGGSVLGCVLSFHLFEVPPVLFNIYVAWYGLKRFSLESVRRFRSLLVFAAAFNLIFFTLECSLLLSGLQRHIPGWEIFGLASIAGILIGGTGLTIYIHQRLIVDH